jgi:hypothetical protein
MLDRSGRLEAKNGSVSFSVTGKIELSAARRSASSRRRLDKSRDLPPSRHLGSSRHITRFQIAMATWRQRDWARKSARRVSCSQARIAFLKAACRVMPFFFAVPSRRFQIARAARPRVSTAIALPRQPRRRRLPPIGFSPNRDRPSHIPSSSSGFRTDCRSSGLGCRSCTPSDPPHRFRYGSD